MERLKFQHLYDDKWATFKKEHGQTYIVFPQDFQPEEGKGYDVEIQWTMMGYFKYNGKGYPVARAHLMDSGGPIAHIIHRIEQRRNQKKPETEIERAFKKAKGEILNG